MRRLVSVGIVLLSCFAVLSTASAQACDQVLYEATQAKVTELSVGCQSVTQSLDKLRSDLKALKARYKKASNSLKRRLKPRLDRLKVRVAAASSKLNKTCGAFTVASQNLDSLAESCLTVFNSPDNQTEPGSDRSPNIDNTLPDTPTAPDAPIAPEVASLVATFTQKGYVVALHGDTASLSTTIFDVTISGYRFLFYPNGIIWYPAEDFFLIRDYFDNSILRPVKFASKTAREFITGSILAKVPGALAVNSKGVFLIYKVKESPTVGFGVLKTADGSEYLVYPKDYNAVIVWMFPQAAYLNLLKFQIISNLLTAQYNTALNIFSNFPGSGTTIEYFY